MHKNNWLSKPLKETQFPKLNIPAALEVSFNLYNSFQSQQNQEDQFFLYVVWLMMAEDKKFYLNNYEYIMLFKNELQSPYFPNPIYQDFYFTKLHYYIWLYNENWTASAFPIFDSNEAKCACVSWIYNHFSIHKNFKYFADELSDIYSQDLSVVTEKGFSFPYFLSLYWESIKANKVFDFLDPKRGLESQLLLAVTYFFNQVLVNKDVNPYLKNYLLQEVIYEHQKMRFIDLLAFKACQLNSIQHNYNIKDVNDFIIWFMNEGAKKFVIQEEIINLLKDQKITDQDQKKSLVQNKSNINLNGVNVVGFPKAEFGLGEVTRSLYLSLEQNKVPANCISLEKNLSDHPLKDLRIEKSISNTNDYKINLFCTTPISIAHTFFDLGPSFFENKFNIGYPFWEFSNWSKKYNFCFAFLDEIWAPSYFLKECFEKSTHKKVLHMPSPVSCKGITKQSRDDFGLPNDQFLFLFMFDFNSSMERKNPYATVEAFKKAFPNNSNVSLVIKTMYSQQNSKEWMQFNKLIENDPRFIIINKVFSRGEVLSLVDNCDAFVSLHRSEGFGLGIAEAMLLNKITIATNYSGNTDFCKPETSLLVPYQIIDVPQGVYKYADGLHWANPDVDVAAGLMQSAYQNNIEVKNKVVKAQQLISQEFSEKTLGKKYKLRIEEILKEIT